MFNLGFGMPVQAMQQMGQMKNAAQLMQGAQGLQNLQGQAMAPPGPVTFAEAPPRFSQDSSGGMVFNPRGSVNALPPMPTDLGGMGQVGLGQMPAPPPQSWIQGLRDQMFSGWSGPEGMKRLGMLAGIAGGVLTDQSEPYWVLLGQQYAPPERGPFVHPRAR